MTQRKTIYVQNLKSEVTANIVHDAFVIFGDIVDIRLAENHQSCLVEFAEEMDAAAAIDNMHLSEIQGQTISASFASRTILQDRRKAIWNSSATQVENRAS